MHDGEPQVLPLEQLCGGTNFFATGAEGGVEELDDQFVVADRDVKSAGIRCGGARLGLEQDHLDLHGSSDGRGFEAAAEEIEIVAGEGLQGRPSLGLPALRLVVLAPEIDRLAANDDEVATGREEAGVDAGEVVRSPPFHLPREGGARSGSWSSESADGEAGRDG